MTDNRPVCCSCERSMICVQNGVVVRYTETTVHRGDKYQCPRCQFSIVTDFGNPYPSIRDWDYRRRP